MFDLDGLKKRAIVERFDTLTQTTGETAVEVANRILSAAQIAIEASCIKYNNKYTDCPILVEAVYIYAVGLLYDANQLSQGKDEMVRAEKLVESYFFSSPKNPLAKSKTGQIVGAIRTVVEDAE